MWMGLRLLKFAAIETEINGNHKKRTSILDVLNLSGSAAEHAEVECLHVERETLITESERNISKFAAVAGENERLRAALEQRGIEIVQQAGHLMDCNDDNERLRVALTKIRATTSPMEFAYEVARQALEKHA
jgi:hypothetical protein